MFILTYLYINFNALKPATDAGYRIFSCVDIVNLATVFFTSC